MAQSQNRRCAICTIALSLEGKTTNIDHCHRTGKIRGLLCVLCNWLIGHARDNPKTLRSAAAYLESTKSATPWCCESP
jgi:hypothetical protein